MPSILQELNKYLLNYMHLLLFIECYYETSIPLSTPNKISYLIPPTNLCYKVDTGITLLFQQVKKPKLRELK